jgi:hypothetical protein
VTRARLAFLAACVIAILAIVAYVAMTRARSDLNAAARAAAGPPVHVEPIASVPDAPFIMFRDASPGEFYGRVALMHLPLGPDPDRDTRFMTSLECERVFYAAGWGVCLVLDDTKLPASYVARVFDRTFAPRHTLPLTGPPIRARVSVDGRRAAFTVFESGHSYADESFSTRTTVIDTASGKPLGELEQFTVRKDGQPFKSIDFNFWGLTFARDGDHFYATLRTKGQRFLVKGSIDKREMEVVRADVECPSLSPDETRVVYKKPVGGVLEVGWRLNVLDLASGVEHPLNQQSRSVDDQVDWFDADHIVYHDSAPQGTGVWLLSVDGASPPRLLLRNAYSPAVQH